MHRCLPSIIAIALVVHSAAPASAVVIYSEIPDGELSGDNTNPTALGLLMPGANTVTGQVTAVGNINDGFNGTADIFSFEIDNGNQLNSIFLTSFSSPNPSNNLFLAMDDQAQFQFSDFEINDQFNLPDLSSILGGVVIGGNEVGTDILDNIADAVNLGAFPPQGSVFSTPLGPGEYSVYIQETSANPDDYTLSFNVGAPSAVPEPSSLAMISVISIAWGTRRYRRRKKATPKPTD